MHMASNKTANVRMYATTPWLYSVACLLPIRRVGHYSDLGRRPSPRLRKISCGDRVWSPVGAVGGGRPWLWMTPDTSTEKIESFERINSMRETNRSFDWRNSCKRLVPGRLHKSHESKLLFVSRIGFIRSKLSIFFCSCIRGQCLRELAEWLTAGPTRRPVCWLGEYSGDLTWRRWCGAPLRPHAIDRRVGCRPHDRPGVLRHGTLTRLHEQKRMKV